MSRQPSRPSCLSFEELENNFMKHPTQMAEYILGIAEEGKRFLLRMIQETLESMNQMIIGSPLRKRHWDIECHSSKQTVKNKLHQLQFPQMEKSNTEKKSVVYLYIEADEDHVSLQFREKKGDLKENENHQKNNCLITKLVYVHEGIENESPKSKRHKLVNPYYFSRVCSGKENEKFWDEVYEYIADHYDLTATKKIYVSGDGGAWIKAGMKRIAGMNYVLNEFHLEKYLTKLISHMLDSRDDAKEELRKSSLLHSNFVTSLEFNLCTIFATLYYHHIFSLSTIRKNIFTFFVIFLCMNMGGCSWAMERN